MLEVEIPGYRKLRFEHLVLDYNGTLACDGHLLEGVKSRLEALAEHVQVHVLTADTFGNARAALSTVACQLHILPRENQAAAKRNYVEELGAGRCVCIGNGRNDALMLKSAGLSIVVIEEEGAAVETILAADVAVPSIAASLDLLDQPLRLVATLRS